MAKRTRRILLLVVLLPVLFFFTGPCRGPRRFDLELPQIYPSKDVAVLARGQYLVEGPAACVECHADPAVIARAKADPAGFPAHTPLIGGRTFDIPLGVYAAPNITPDQGTHVGSLAGPQTATMLRYSVDADRHVVPPFMHHQGLSDEDLTAVVSYLRAQPGVTHDVVPRQWKLFSDLKLKRLAPLGPKGTPPKHVEEGPTAQYGEYLAHAVADCYGCHTDQSLDTGAFTGEPFAGGVSLASTSDPKLLYVSPNITPDPKSGKMVGWNEELFIAKFRLTSHPEGTSMPWTAFRKMKDDDLRALYRYLVTVKAVANDPSPATRARPQ